MRVCLLLFLALSFSSLLAENWPSWRGPRGDGSSAESNLPLHWSASEHLAWKLPLPQPGNSTPVVWGNRVFITQAAEPNKRRELWCVDASKGELLWKQGVEYTQAELTHSTNPYCSGSPATDGEVVIAFFASAGLHAYDLDGRPLWQRSDLGKLHHIWGSGTSPVIAGQQVFLNFGPGENTALWAFDKRTGKTLWKQAQQGGASGEAGNKQWLGSWADPLLKTVHGRQELLMAWPREVCAYDPQSGSKLWSCAGLNALVYNSPLYDEQRQLVVAFGGYGGMGVAVRAGGSGEVTENRRLWHLPKVSQRIGSGVLHDGLHLILSDPGFAECRDLASGELLWNERLKGAGATGQNWSSLLLSADGRCYAVNQGGDAFVFKAGRRFELLAQNPMGEKVIGSIAASQGRLYIRGHRHLFCIGKP